jgi:desert hedgehog
MLSSRSVAAAAAAAAALSAIACAQAAALVHDGVEVRLTSSAGEPFLSEASARQAAAVGLWPGIDGTYRSVFRYNNNTECPNTVGIKNNFALDADTNLSTVAHGDISEDGVACNPEGIFFSASIPFFLSADGQDYASLSHGNVLERLKANPAAAGAVNQFKDSRVGYDDYKPGGARERVCGRKKYNDKTFWFSIQGGIGNKVSIGPVGSPPTVIPFPVDTKGIFLMASSPTRFCILLTDPDTSVKGTTAPPKTTAGAAATAAAPITVPKATTVTSSATGSSSATAAGDSASTGTGDGSDKETTTYGKPSCFPAGATVEVASGGLKRMDELAAGDRVHVGRGVYSDVFMFTHKSVDAVAEFVQIETTSGHVLRASAGHYLYVNGQLAAAATVRPGDTLVLGSGAWTTASSVSVEAGVGLFNPQTLHGDIVVNAVLCSTYTRALEPTLAHAALAPARALYKWFGAYTPSFDDGADALASRLPQGTGVVH